MHQKARETIRGFPTEVRVKLGQALYDLQQGFRLGMPKSRPFGVIGKGVHELRVRGREGVFRVFYHTGDEQGVLVFHAFLKKSQKTPWLEIDLGQRRLKELLYGKK